MLCVHYTLNVTCVYHILCCDRVRIRVRFRVRFRSGVWVRVKVRVRVGVRVNPLITNNVIFKKVPWKTQKIPREKCHPNSTSIIFFLA